MTKPVILHAALRFHSFGAQVRQHRLESSMKIKEFSNCPIKYKSDKYFCWVKEILEEHKRRFIYNHKPYLVDMSADSRTQCSASKLETTFSFISMNLTSARECQMVSPYIYTSIKFKRAVASEKFINWGQYTTKQSSIPINAMKKIYVLLKSY